MLRIFIFGLGYSALALAGQLRSLGWEVAGTTRRESKMADLRQLGFTVYPFSRGEPLTVGSAALADFPYILNSVPPDDLGDPVYDLHSCDIVAQAPQLKWFGYLSTTGVYGDHKGAVVDETTPCQPTSARAAQRLEVERQWQELYKNCGLPLHIYRLAGIYGPGRNVLRDLQRGLATQIIKPGHVFNRIHVADIVQALVASLHKPAPGNIYNLADDASASSDAVVRFGAELLAMPAPEPLAHDAAPLSPMAKIFYADSKVVANAKVKRDLGLKLLYPTYREGLRALKP